MILTADQVREAGAGAGSGLHLLYRFSAINHTKAGDKVRRYPTLQAVQPEVAAAGETAQGDDVAGDSTVLRMATFTVGDAPHDALIDAGFVDSASAAARANIQYSTFNGFAVTQKVSGMRFGSRLDGLFVSGGTARSYENVTKVKDTARPSDHNMVLSTLVLEK